MLDLDAIDAALAKMTPEDWEKDYGSTLGHIKSVAQRDDATTPTVLRYDVDTPFLTDEQKEANAEGIVLLRNNAREMVAEIRRLRKLCYEADYWMGEIDHRLEYREERARLREASRGEL